MKDPHQTQLYKKIKSFVPDIAEADIDKLFNTLNWRKIKKGETILNMGEICKKIAFVELGYFRTYQVYQGNEVNTAFTFEDNFVTDHKSIRYRIISESTIQAGEDAEIFEFERDKMFELYKGSPAIESFGRKLLEQFVAEQEEQTNVLRFLSSEEKYDYLTVHHPHLIQRVSLSQISSYLGIARETLSRIRRKK